MKEKDAKTLEILRNECLYIQTLPELGPLDTVGPDWAEQHVYDASSVLSGHRTKKQGFADTRTKMIPQGLPPTDH